jgi:RNA polymerase sigma-70 factor, ECF subfamily
MTPDERARLRAAWAAHGIELADAELADYAAVRRARVGADARLLASDLGLACACERGDPRAIREFEARYLPAVRRALARARVPAAVADDVVAGLTARLFTAVGGAAPLVAGYTGRGELGAWTRSVALHEALTRLRRERRQLPFDGAAHDVPLADPELVYLREHYAASLGDVLAEAFAALAPDERAILRQYYRHGLTIDDLGRLHGVHRVTAARRIRHAREALVREVRGRVGARLDAGDPTVDSILRLVGSRLAVERVLRSTLRDSDG